MIKQQLIILAVFLPVVLFGQTKTKTDFITISSSVLGREFKEKVKIDQTTGDIYSRKNKIISNLKNDPSVLFFKDSLSYHKLDSLVKKDGSTGFNEVRYKIEFIQTTCSFRDCPCYTHINIIEFVSHRNEQHGRELDKIIDLYYTLRAKIY